MKYIVLGDGLLGSEIVKQTGWDFVSRKKDNIDISVPFTYQHNIVDYNVIVNCIAFTKTYSTDKESNWKVNVEFVNDLITFCNIHNKKLVHISTDYVYANSVKPASETDLPIPVNTWYGYSKLLGDQLIELRSKNYLICRLSHKPFPFPYKEAWTDMYTNGDYVDVISSMVIKLINKGSSGIFNVGTRPKTIYELALESSNILPIFKPDYVPGNTIMNIDKFNNEIV